MSSSGNMRFHLDTPLVEGLSRLFCQLEQKLALQRPVNVYLAGGMAAHLYTGSRYTSDIDAEFGARLLLPPDTEVSVQHEDGSTQTLYLDTNYNPSFALMHEDYQHDALSIELGTSMLRVHVLTPVDLAVSKLARFSENDREDIIALMTSGLTTGEQIAARAKEALPAYVGNPQSLMWHLEETLRLAKEIANKA